MASASRNLRLFSAEDHSPSDSDDGLTPDSTLTELFERYVLPNCLVNSEPRNIQQIRESLRYWRRFTGDPSLRLTSVRTCAEFLGRRDERGRFVSGLWSLPGRKGEPISPNTVRKHCVEIQRLLSLAGPITHKHPEARELIDRVPWLAKPAVVKREVVDNLSLDELRAVREACKRARSPRRLPHGLTPARFFDALYVFDYHVGARLGTLLAVRYSWFGTDVLGERCLHVPLRFTKGKKRDLLLFVHDDAWRAVESIRTPDRDLVFPWPHGPSWLHECRRRILRASGLPPHRQLGFHGIRKAMTTELGAINGPAATMAAGHAGEQSAVTREHYLGRKVMVDAMKKMPRLAGDEAEDGFLGSGI